MLKAVKLSLYFHLKDFVALLAVVLCFLAIQKKDLAFYAS